MRAFFCIGIAAGVAAITAASCGSDTISETHAGGNGGTGNGTAGEDDVIGGQASWQVDTGSGGCNSLLYEPPVVKSPHVDACSDIDYPSMPPTSGPHYARWAHFQTYDEPVPWGYLVHAMEHGGMVFSYNCDLYLGGSGGSGGGGGGSGGAAPADDCAAAVATLQAYVDTLPIDETCQPLLPRRAIIAPAPDLDVGFAVSAWGFMMKADCIDTDIIDGFYDARYRQGPEDLCGSGIDPFSDDHKCD